MSGDDCQLLGFRNRNGRVAAEAPGIAAGHDAAAHGPHCRHAGLARAGATPRTREAQRSAASLCASLEHESLRGAEARTAQRSGNPRSGSRVATCRDGRTLRGLYRRGARTASRNRLPPAARTTANAATDIGWPLPGPVAWYSAVAVAGRGAAGVRDCGAVLPAVGRGRGTGHGRPRTVDDAGYRLPAAGAAAVGDDRRAFLGTAAFAAQVIPVAGQVLRPSAEAAAGILRAPPSRRRRFALRSIQACSAA